MDQIDPIQLLLAGVPDYAVFLLDTAGCISRWSLSAEKMFEYTAEEIQGKPLSVLYPAAESGDVAEEIQMAAAHGRFEDIGCRVKKDGSQFCADSALCPLRGEGGSLIGFSLVMRNIDERKKAEEALKIKEEELIDARKLEAIGRLAGSVAHDFNNYITAIVGLADEVRMSMSSIDPRRQDLEDIIKTADQARILTRNLLAFGRRQPTAPQIIDLNAFLDDKQRMLKRLLGADVVVELNPDPAVGHMLIDPTHLDQILINLVMNARDAMPRGGRLRIKIRAAANSQIHLVISDTGSGMKPEVLDHIFEPFFTTKEQGKGTGLGLATVYGIVKQAHGDISVTSQIGEGTTFTIRFPAIDAAVKAPPQSAFSSPVSGKETVLVVEDTEIVRRTVTRTLQKCGYHILSAASGSEALQCVKDRTEAIHLILTDFVMPGMNGLQLAEALRQKHPEAAVLVMSAYPDGMPYEHNAYPPGMAFIEKPFSSAMLVQKVREMLESPRTMHLANPR